MKEHSPTSTLVARDQLIEQHRSYVRALSVKVMQSLAVQVDLQELVAYGDVGLIEAAERFDPRRGVAFSTFAHYRIKGAIYDGLREMGVLTRSSNARARWAANSNDLLQSAAADERAPAQGATSTVDDEIAAAQSFIDTLIPAYLLSLESDSIPEVADPHALTREQVERRELVNFVLEALRAMSDEEQQLIDALYFKHRSMTDMAALMGVTKSWISRLHSRAIQHLRDQMRERGVLA